ncbi:MAG: methyltransferase [Alteraurantiacibacter sp. bin_em_oilr2.035]|nr:methyltransferase [Alteraurantiacibacter sp. bin_em_oilr2.035]
MSKVLAEHLSYFHLPRRYDAYARTIASVLSGGEALADLGCGFGVLGIQCVRHNARHVWGIDHSDAIEIARETVDRSGLADQYTCIKNSTFQTILPEKADLGEVRLDENVEKALSFSATLTADRDCMLHGLAGWFDCELADDVWMTNSPIVPESIRRPQAFFPLQRPIEVKQGDSFDIAFRIRHGQGIFAWTVTPADGAPIQRMNTWKSRILTDKDLETRPESPLRMNSRGTARLKTLELIDNKRTAHEIEALVLETYPELFATPEEISRFLRAELGAGTES